MSIFNVSIDAFDDVVFTIDMHNNILKHTFVLLLGSLDLLILSSNEVSWILILWIIIFL